MGKKNELEVLKDKEALTKVITGSDNSLSIKPLVKEIELFDSFIAGTFYLEDKSPLERLKVGDSLTLVREKDNAFDSNAVRIQDKEGKKVGYIPEKDNSIVVRLMDAGKEMKAKVKRIDSKREFLTFAITICLEDF